jgi:hypothetical protein
LIGYAGADTILGNAGDDFIDGGAGDDRLNGGTRNDRFDWWEPLGRAVWRRNERLEAPIIAGENEWVW